jgi:hypothetical protein
MTQATSSYLNQPTRTYFECRVARLIRRLHGR